MLRSKKRRILRKVMMLCLLMIVAIGVQTSSISAKTTSERTWLKKTITYCDKLKKAEYTSVTWKSFQKELKEAKAVYKKTNKKDSYYLTARNELEQAKAKLMFVDSKEESSPLTFRALSVDQMVDEMGTGWNLGNTMDAHSGLTPNETGWQHVVTTKALIKKVHDMGFNTIRIPVTWGTKINDDYTIDEAWISRVQDIVDYCISQDMYVIINLHHDGAEQAAWLNVANPDVDPIYEKYENVWRNIAKRFKDYDEHLIFESMNEVWGGRDSTPEQDFKVIENLNQIFVNVVRSTGSNNTKRWLSVPGRYTNIETTTDSKYDFNIPADKVKNRIFVSVHDYDYLFGLKTDMAVTKYNSVKGLAERCQNLVEKFTSKGIPVILGEYGAANKNNTKERAYYYEAFTRISQLDGVVACVWDTGDYDLKANPADYSFSLVDRETLKEVYPDLVNAILRGTFLPATTDDYSDIVKAPKITKVKEISLSDTQLSLTIGDSKDITVTVSPSNSNDVVVWNTADPTIATVSNGHVRARGIGVTTLTASSRSGSAKKVVVITVNAKNSENPCTVIATGKDTYTLETGNYAYLNTSLTPAKTDDFVTYKSSDETIATVSSIGKIVACGDGTAYITITASNGLTKVVKVIVKPVEKALNEIDVALNVLYNDSAISYYGNELGEVVKITKNGQYTVSFDCDTELSKTAVKAGVTSLANLTAIYIKDYNVTNGKVIKSNLVSCDIMYDKITVDGVDLTITQTEPKSAIKASGVLDTNDPLNSWDGSSVKETSIDSNHVLNIKGFKNPKKIEITFTISNLKFEGEDDTSASEKPVDIAATDINAVTSDPVVISKVGDTAEISAVLNPIDATSGVTFVSSDASVAAVDGAAVTADQSGNVVITLTALKKGTATITAYTEEGLTVTFEVKVEN